MKARRILSLVMALVLIASFSVFAYAEAGDDEQPSVFTVATYYDDGKDEVVSVKLNGQELDDEGDGLQFEPGSALTVEITLNEGYTLGDDTYFVPSGIWIYWYGEDSETDDIEGLGVHSSDVEFVNGQKNVIKATINVPSADWLENDQYISLCFASYEEGYDPNAGRITKVVLNAPIIKAGEGYTVSFDEQTENVIQNPRPNVTVPAEAVYAIGRVNEDELSTYWLAGEGGPHPYDYRVSGEDTTFENGEWYYIGVELYAVNDFDIPDPFQIEPTDPGEIGRGMRSPEEPVLNFFDSNEDYWPEIEVKNGELVTFSVQSGYYGEQYTNYLVAVIRVTPQKDSPNTGEMNPLPYMAGIILSLSLVITIIDDDRRRFANR